MKIRLAYIEKDINQVKIFVSKLKDDYDILLFENSFYFLNWITEKSNHVNVIVSGGNIDGHMGLPLLKELKSFSNYKSIPFILISPPINFQVRRMLVKEGVSELFNINFEKENFKKRVNYLLSNPYGSLNVVGIQKIPKYKTPILKRLFDIAFSLTLLILLSPLFAVISILIVLESRGPIYYSSKRVGTGYKIFNFYKFRSMTLGADAKLKEISHLNQYQNPSAKTTEQTSPLCNSCIANTTSCQAILYLDGDAICEKSYAKAKAKKKAGTFIKISNDPRVTRVGQFIRNTSIDELPQLINVLKGDMSIVGNRPLPLYEAEKITTDKFSTRFLAPAGITGLWQVTKRGAGKMSEEERIQLDNDYALTYSFITDISIMLKTIPALIQKENV